MIPTLTLSLAMMVGGITPPIQIIHSGNPAANITDPINANAGRIEVIVNAPSTDYVYGFIIRIEGGFPVMTPAVNSYDMTDSRWHLVWGNYGNNAGEGGEGQILRIDCHSNGTLESLDYTLNLPAKEVDSKKKLKEKAEATKSLTKKKVQNNELILPFAQSPSGQVVITEGVSQTPRHVGYLLERNQDGTIKQGAQPIAGRSEPPIVPNQWRITFANWRPGVQYFVVVRSQNKDNSSMSMSPFNPIK